MKKSIILTSLSFLMSTLICAFIAWCSGFNFDHRNIDVGLYISQSLVCSFMVSLAVYLQNIE